MTSTRIVPRHIPLSLFFIVPAKTSDQIVPKITELEGLGWPYIIICGERVEHPHVVYRPAKGKYDALNYGVTLLPADADIIVFNDVDTKIHNFRSLLPLTTRPDLGVVFTRVQVANGPQHLFYQFLDRVRKRILIAASGELMILHRELINRVFPIPPCKAEDSYILFKALELGYPARFITRCATQTERPITLELEEQYKRRTVAGIYQALTYTKPSLSIRVFYILLPLFAPLLLVLGKTGYHWMHGIHLGFLDHRRGDVRGSW